MEKKKESFVTMNFIYILKNKYVHFVDLNSISSPSTNFVMCIVYIGSNAFLIKHFFLIELLIIESSSS